jgi:hypothetical protein
MHYFLYDEIGSVVYHSSISLIIRFLDEKNVVKNILSEVQVQVEHKTQNKILILL